ncbi:MAG TPA: FkbM family methyltransferase [Fibrobacteria bacterium]|nr:FkbM family methyltransferase [Fibrobacteria bacterium]
MAFPSLKQGLLRLVGNRGYRTLHGAWFLARLLLALALPAYGRAFFGHDMLALAARLRPGDTVLDIGAYLGGTAVLFARRVRPHGRVLAVEPFHHGFLVFVARLLRLPIQVIPSALGSAPGEADLVVPIRAGVPLYSQAAFAESYDTEALIRSGTYAFQRATTRRERLDDVLAREGLRPDSVAAVKIDVEGAEHEVLAGGEAFFNRFAGPLLCEFWYNVLPPAGWLWLIQRGWRCRKLLPDGRLAEAGTLEQLAVLAHGETYGNFWWERVSPLFPPSVPR